MKDRITKESDVHFMEITWFLLSENCIINSNSQLPSCLQSPQSSIAHIFGSNDMVWIKDQTFQKFAHEALNACI